MDLLLLDLERRHKRKVSALFTVGDEMLVVDLLSPRSTDVYPTTRIVAVGEAGAGVLKVSTCLPDFAGECERPTNHKEGWDGSLERLTHLKGEYWVSTRLVGVLQAKGALITDKKFKVASNEYVLHLEWYLRFREAHGDIEYQAVLH